MPEKLSRKELLVQVYLECSCDASFMKDVVQAASDGVLNIVEEVKDKYAKKDRAFLASLSLVNATRLTEDTKKMLNDAVVEGISDKNRCGAEDKFLDSLKS